MKSDFGTFKALWLLVASYPVRSYNCCEFSCGLHQWHYKLIAFNPFFNSCNNQWGLSGRDNILWLMVASKFQLPIIWQPSGSGHIIDHLNLELLLLLFYTYMYLAMWKGVERMLCSAAWLCDGCIIQIPKGINPVEGVNPLQKLWHTT